LRKRCTRRVGTSKRGRYPYAYDHDGEYPQAFVPPVQQRGDGRTGALVSAPHGSRREAPGKRRTLSGIQPVPVEHRSCACDKRY